MPNIEIRMQTVALVALLLLLAVAAPFLTALIPDSEPVTAMAAQDTPQEIVLTVADAAPTAVPPLTPPTPPAETDSTYLRAVQVQIKSLLASQKATPQPRTSAVEVRVNTGTGANLNVRAAPGLVSPVLGGAIQGEILPAIAVSLDTFWLQVRWNGLIGWVYAPLTVPVAGDAATLPVTSEQ